jgi:hypothetical protein
MVGQRGAFSFVTFLWASKEPRSAHEHLKKQTTRE